MALIEVSAAILTTTNPTPLTGLTEAEVAQRTAQGLVNAVQARAGRSYAQIARDNLFTFFNLVLFSLGAILLLLGSPRDAFFTAAIAFLNAIVGTVQEVRAKRKLDQIALLTRPQATVIRAGQTVQIDPAAVVLDDLLVVGPGDQALVDGVVVQGAADFDESLLTGESDPVAKRVGDQVLSGSHVLLGRLFFQAQQVGGGVRPIEDEALLDEVTALVERPHVLICQFEKEFLEVPQECLILTMKANQKYFPLLDAQGKLTHQFLVVSNIQPQDPSAVIDGNERVVRPRLADAKFFFDQDRKKTLESRIGGLAKVVYHNQLGTQAERSERVRQIAHAIVNQLRMATSPYSAEDKERFDVLDSKVQEAARLAKTDLLTDMVGEFPELQGIMGGYYARSEGLRDGVALAIEDHYKPRFAGDELPRNHTGSVLALADKLETLVGMFGIGNLPTGDKDPFALRRHALGVIRLLVEKQLPLNLPELLQAAAQSFDTLLPDAAKSNAQLQDFVYERLSGYLRERGASVQEAEALIAVRPAWGEIPKALEAVRTFAQLPEAPALAAANKRIGNILKKAGEAGQQVDAHVSEVLLQEQAEKDLYAAMQTLVPQANGQFDVGNYTASLQTLAALRAPVDAFFDGVMVNAEQMDLRMNRLGLLKALHMAMNRVADLARLAA